MKTQSADVGKTCETVVRMPRTLVVRGDVSPYGLVENSGYFDRHVEITPDLLRLVLSGDPTLVDDWLEYSENRRTSAGWYLCRTTTGFGVGFLGGDGRKVDEHTYVDGIEACAVFIKNELEEMRRLR